MAKFRKGDIVGRISYNKDVIFEITNILNNNKKEKIYILKGVTERIEADSPEEDLEILDKRMVNENIKKQDSRILERIQTCLVCEDINNKINIQKYKILGKRSIKTIYTGKILHLDGDRKYSEKSARYYRSLGLNAVVKNVPENKQPEVVANLLEKYNPDILIITGHDGMIKKESNFNDIFNYRNSRFFVKTVNEARKWNRFKQKKLAIFAGACQSYYEAIIAAGANFAASPKRIMIDFIDPLIVAQRIATTENTKYLTIKDIEKELRDGRDGVSGIGTMGKKVVVIK